MKRVYFFYPTKCYHIIGSVPPPYLKFSPSFTTDATVPGRVTISANVHTPALSTHCITTDSLQIILLSMEIHGGVQVQPFHTTSTREKLPLSSKWRSGNRYSPGARIVFPLSLTRPWLTSGGAGLTICRRCYCNNKRRLHPHERCRHPFLFCNI
jgi:hypothetical protein